MEKSLLSLQETTRNSPDSLGMSACVIEQTMPGSVLSASAVVLNPIWRAALHSAALVPPNSSRNRVLTMRAAWLLVDVPERLTLDFRYIGPAPPPTWRAWSMSYTATLLFTNAKSWSAKLAVRWLNDGLAGASCRLRNRVLPSVNASTTLLFSRIPIRSFPKENV